MGWAEFDPPVCETCENFNDFPSVATETVKLTNRSLKEDVACLVGASSSIAQIAQKSGFVAAKSAANAAIAAAEATRVTATTSLSKNGQSLPSSTVVNVPCDTCAAGSRAVTVKQAVITSGPTADGKEAAAVDKETKTQKANKSPAEKASGPEKANGSPADAPEVEEEVGKASSIEESNKSSVDEHGIQGAKISSEKASGSTSKGTQSSVDEHSTQDAKDSSSKAAGPVLEGTKPPAVNGENDVPSSSNNLTSGKHGPEKVTVDDPKDHGQKNTVPDIQSNKAAGSHGQGQGKADQSKAGKQNATVSALHDDAKSEKGRAGVEAPGYSEVVPPGVQEAPYSGAVRIGMPAWMLILLISIFFGFSWMI